MDRSANLHLEEIIINLGLRAERMPDSMRYIGILLCIHQGLFLFYDIIRRAEGFGLILAMGRDSIAALTPCRKSIFSSFPPYIN